jgi:hypothetical protein
MKKEGQLLVLSIGHWRSSVRNVQVHQHQQLFYYFGLREGSFSHPACCMYAEYNHFVK